MGTQEMLLSRATSLGLSPLFRVSPLCRRHISRDSRSMHLPSLRSHPLQRFPDIGQPLPPKGNQPSSHCLPSVSRALKALLRPIPVGLVSCRSRSWGFSLQGFSLADRYTFSSASTLLRLAHQRAAALHFLSPRQSRSYRFHKSFSKQCFLQLAPLQGLTPYKCCSLPVQRLFRPGKTYPPGLCPP